MRHHPPSTLTTRQFSEHTTHTACMKWTWEMNDDVTSRLLLHSMLDWAQTPPHFRQQGGRCSDVFFSRTSKTWNFCIVLYHLLQFYDEYLIVSYHSLERPYRANTSSLCFTSHIMVEMWSNAAVSPSVECRSICQSMPFTRSSLLLWYLLLCHRPSAITKLYRFVTVAHGCEQVSRDCYLTARHQSLSHQSSPMP